MGIGAAVIGSSVIGAIGAKKGADAQADAAAASNALQKEMYDQTRADLNPYRTAGSAGLDAYMASLGFTPNPVTQPPDSTSTQSGPNIGALGNVLGQNRKITGYDERTGDPIYSENAVDERTGDPVSSGGGYSYSAPNQPDFGLAALSRGFQSSPGYQFQIDEGTRAIENSAAARGMLNSGRTLKDLTRFGQGVANQDYWNYINANRQGVADNYQTNQTQLDRLSGLSTLGQNAAVQQANAGQNYASAYGNNAARGAAATASGYAGVANAAQNGLQQYAAFKGYGTGFNA